MHNQTYVIPLTIIIAILFAACGSQESDPERWLQESPFAGEMERLAYTDSLNGLRLAKDEWMRSDESTPLTPGDKEFFTGLHYFDVDPDMVFRVRLHIYPEPELITIATTTGVDREAIRYGYFDITIEDTLTRIHAYKFTRHRGTEMESYIFIPFIDASAGIETYEGGRYLDVEEVYPGIIEVDFNDAYNPYCVYNERYSCPIPPRENQLAVAINAGEKNFK